MCDAVGSESERLGRAASQIRKSHSKHAPFFSEIYRETMQIPCRCVHVCVCIYSLKHHLCVSNLVCVPHVLLDFRFDLSSFFCRCALLYCMYLSKHRVDTNIKRHRPHLVQMHKLHRNFLFFFPLFFIRNRRSFRLRASSTAEHADATRSRLELSSVHWVRIRRAALVNNILRFHCVDFFPSTTNNGRRRLE